MTTKTKKASKKAAHGAYVDLAIAIAAKPRGFARKIRCTSEDEARRIGQSIRVALRNILTRWDIHDMKASERFAVSRRGKSILIRIVED